MTNRILARAQSLARRNPIYPPLLRSFDALCLLAVVLVGAAAAIGLGWLP